MIDIQKAKNNPANLFNRPKDIVNNNAITKKDKIDILNRWAYDERELEVAEEENMSRAEDDYHAHLLDEILLCLLELGVEGDQPEHPPTKHG